jgi:hypothetical protein
MNTAVIAASIAIFLSVVALFLSLACADVVRRWRNLPAKRAEELETLAAELDERIGNLYESHKRLRSRIGMRELRQRRGGPDYEGDDEKPDKLDLTAGTASYADYKAKLRERIGLKPGKPAPTVRK